jgi:hypothetical protein
MCQRSGLIRTSHGTDGTEVCEGPAASPKSSIKDDASRFGPIVAGTVARGFAMSANRSRQPRASERRRKLILHLIDPSRFFDAVALASE